MALQNVEANITLDIYNHDTTPATIKAIQLDSQTRYVAAMLQNIGVQYDVDSGATVQLIVVRPDKVGVQITGTTFTYGDEGSEYLGPYAELTQVALAVNGKMRGQFKITSGNQILRTEIFAISNGEALDASTDEWADEYDGYNLEEMATSIETNTADIATLEADVSQIKEELNTYDDILSVKDNVDISFQNAGSGRILYTDGTVADSSSFDYTDYIDVSIYKMLTYKRIKNSGRTVTYGMAFYDGNKTFVSGIRALTYADVTGYRESTIYVPDGVKYARFTIFTDTVTYGEFTLSGSSVLFNSIDSVRNYGYKALHWTIYGQGCIGSDGDVNTSATSYKYTDYVDVSDCKKIRFKNIGVTSTASARMAFYDANYNLISVIRGFGGRSVIGYTELFDAFVPDRAVYARFSVFGDTATYGEFELYGMSELGNDIVTAKSGCFTVDDAQAVVSSYSSMIALYDALVTAYPNYVTKNTLASGSVTNYEYVFSNGNYNSKNGMRSQDAEIAKPVILICSGVHGDEQSSATGLYYLLKSMCENSLGLSSVIDYVELKVIPVVNIWGYDNIKRLNENSVNINRNFDSSTWTRTSAGSNYSGAEGGDQDETKIVQNWIDANVDALAFIDWHNSLYTNEVSCLLSTLNTADFTTFKKRYLRAISRIVPYWASNRGLYENNNIYAYTGTSTNSGTSISYASDKGLLAFTLETTYNNLNSDQDSNFTIGIGTEVMGAILNGIKQYWDE